MSRKLELLALAIVVLASGCVTKKKYDTLAKKHRTLQQENATLKQEVEKLTAQLALERKQHEQKAAELNARIKELTRQSEELKKTLEGMKGRTGELQAKLQATQNELQLLAKARAEAEERARTLRRLSERFKAMIRAGNLEVINRNGRLILKLKAAILFDPGRTKLKKEGIRALRDIAEVLRRIPNKHFQVAGHTDNDPVRHSRFRDNWELSVMRAVNVVRELQKAGVPGKMLSAAGYAEFQPVRPNDTPQNKKFNRRIEIQIIPDIPTFLE